MSQQTAFLPSGHPSFYSSTWSTVANPKGEGNYRNRVTTRSPPEEVWMYTQGKQANDNCPNVLPPAREGIWPGCTGCCKAEHKIKAQLYCQRHFAVVARGLTTQMSPSTSPHLSACVCCSTALLSPQEDFCNIWEHSWAGSCWREQGRGVCIWHWNNSPGASLILGIPQAFFFILF